LISDSLGCTSFRGIERVLLGICFFLKFLSGSSSSGGVTMIRGGGVCGERTGPDIEGDSSCEISSLDFMALSLEVSSLEFSFSGGLWDAGR
jgi:hypothetical protein